MGFEEDIQQRISQRKAAREDGEAELQALIQMNLRKLDELAETAKQGALLLLRRGVPMNHRSSERVRYPKTTFWGRDREEVVAVDIGWYLPSTYHSVFGSLMLTKDGGVQGSYSGNDYAGTEYYDYLAMLRGEFESACDAFGKDPVSDAVLKANLEELRYLKTGPERREILADEILNEIARYLEG